MDDIIKQLARQFGGNTLADVRKAVAPPPPPAPEPRRTRWDDADDSFDLRSGSYRPKLWPSERMQLGTDKASARPKPMRGAVQISEFTLDELDWMFGTPAKKNWVFEDWLEVIGLPPDLHPLHDGRMYEKASKAFLERKREAHGVDNRN